MPLRHILGQPTLGPNIGDGKGETAPQTPNIKNECGGPMTLHMMIIVMK